MSHETPWFEGRQVEESDMFDDDPKSTRLGTLLIVALLALIAAGVAVSARAAPTMKGEGSNGMPMSLKLLEEPCKESVAKWLPIRVRPEFHHHMRAAVLHWGGKDYDACWIMVDDAIYSIDEQGVLLNGGQGLPRRFFRDEGV